MGERETTTGMLAIEKRQGGHTTLLVLWVTFYGGGSGTAADGVLAVRRLSVVHINATRSTRSDDDVATMIFFLWVQKPRSPTARRETTVAQCHRRDSRGGRTVSIHVAALTTFICIYIYI